MWRARYLPSLIALLTLVLCSFRYFTSVSNLKAIGQLHVLMEILHFRDLGDTECRFAANAVVLVFGESHILIATHMYLRGVSTVTKSCIAMYWELTMYATLKSSQTDRQTDTQTRTQPQCNNYLNYVYIYIYIYTCIEISVISNQ